MQEILRHSDISVTTGTYIEVTDRVEGKAVAGMNTLLAYRPDRGRRLS